jgi:hypothetical protein
MDKILLEGDSVYRTLKLDTDKYLVSLMDLKVIQSVIVSGQQYNIEYCMDEAGEPLCGLLYMSSMYCELALYTLNQALDVLFNKQCNGCLLVLVDYTVAIIRSGSSFFVFDSHSRNCDGMQCESGTSTLVYVGTTCLSVSNFIIRLSQSLQLRRNAQFEIIGIKCTPEVVQATCDQDQLVATLNFVSCFMFHH